MDKDKKNELLSNLVDLLLEERGEKLPSALPDSELWPTFRALVNTRPPLPASEHLLALQDELLRGMIDEAGVYGLADAAVPPVNPQLLLWRGDITTFAADAIVNAANFQMLGCWVPGHHCIDNAIHTFAGIQLRLECARIMSAQGHEEPTAAAKITPAYNLPSKYIIHTVGPIAGGRPTNKHRQQLALCYENCLNLAYKHELTSLAFCCISTGVFGFPQDEAAQIAVDSVRTWLDAHAEADIKVVFNVFLETDSRIYSELLGCDVT